MSGSTLGTLLVQRLDAVLGNAVASHPHLIVGSRATAVVQPGATARMQAPEEATRAPPAPGMLGEAETQVDSRVRARQSPPGTVAGKPAGTAETASAGTTRGQVPLQGAPTASASTLLGPTAKLIQALFGSNAPTPTHIKGIQPLLLPGQAPDPATIGRQLHRAIATSGLFYESHLNSMTFGKLAPAALALEPQADWRTQATSNAQNSADTRATAHRPTAEASGALDGSRTPEVASMLKHQLETLAAQQVVWRGEAWPDAPMAWQVTRAPRDPDASAQAPGQWQTTLSVTLPNLGEVHAHIRIVDDHVSMRIESATPAHLQSAARALQHGLTTHGLQATALDIVGLPSTPEAGESE